MKWTRMTRISSELVLHRFLGRSVTDHVQVMEFRRACDSPIYRGWGCIKVAVIFL